MSFWRKEHDKERDVVVHHCDRHDFHTYDPLEIEEHEKMHALEESGAPY